MSLARVMVLVAISAIGCDSPKPLAEPAPPASATAAATPAPSHVVPEVSGLTRVDVASQVCMVNDQFMGKEQIPVVVGGKTYFGCCEMCKAKLENNADVRTAADPVSGKRVDKATALIARNEAGKVFYFESEATLGRYKP